MAMKTKLIGVVVVVAGAMFLLAPAFGGISGSAHDFSAEGWSQGKMCMVCHTPHNANPEAVGAPLWNHEITAATYSVYASPTMDATDLGEPGSTSKLCLSCHDGTVAIDSFGGNSGYQMMSGPANIGTDLSGTHPISFTYDEALALEDGRLYDPATTQSGLGGTISEDMLTDSKMECSSCHDIHNTTGLQYLLKQDNMSGTLCLTCHNM